MSARRRHTAREDRAHLLAHFAVLYQNGAELISTRQGWTLRVTTMAGAMAWPIQEYDLPLFDRVPRVVPSVLGDPRAAIAPDAVAHHNQRLRMLTDAAWLGTTAADTRADHTDTGDHA